MSNQPLVSIGLPTYNRASTLGRALESALMQDYRNIELVISDNGSTDGTQTICEDFCQRDNRIRYLRQSSNIGMTANFQALLKAARGEFFMWLADDDWLDQIYISECLRVLLENPDHALVCGRGKFFEGPNYLFDEEVIDLLDSSSGERVLSHYRQVRMNGMFYGLMRRELLKHTQIENAPGGDWLIVARMAFSGKARTLPQVAINRSAEGVSGNLEQLARSQGVSSVLAKRPFLVISYVIFRDIAWKGRVYASLSRRSRLVLAVHAAAIIADRYQFPGLRAKLILRTRLKRGLQRCRNIWKLGA